MTIKEVEKILEIPKATIRFYEKEELVKPQRGSNTYREYTEADVERLRKIIVLRKIGMPVVQIKNLFDDTVSLQNALSENVADLRKQMQEIEGAMRVCELMQKKEETIATLDESYYWEVIHEEEQAGNKFFEILSDVVDFEKKVIFDEFGIGDENGKLKYSPMKAAFIAIGCCFGAGLLWFVLDGFKVNAFVEGFFFPLVCILISSVIGLPLYFMEKKYPAAVKIIKRIGMFVAVALLIIVIILMILEGF